MLDEKKPPKPSWRGKIAVNRASFPVKTTLAGKTVTNLKPAQTVERASLHPLIENRRFN